MSAPDPRTRRATGAGPAHRRGQVDPPAGGPDHHRLGSHRRRIERHRAAARSGRPDAVGVDEPGRSAVGDRDEARRRSLRRVQVGQRGDDRSRRRRSRSATTRTGTTTNSSTRLEADTNHVEHVQDFWGDPLTAAGAQSGDGKAAYVQVYLAGNMGEALSNESVLAGQEARRRASSATGREGVRDRRLRAGGRPADRERPQHPDHRDGHFRGDHHDADARLPIDTNCPARAGDGGSDVVGHARCGGVPRLPRADRVVDIRDEPPCHAGDRRGDGLRHLPHRPVSGSANDRRGPRVGLLHDVSRHCARGAGLGDDDRGRDLLPVVHPVALLPVAGRSAGRGYDHRRARRADVGAGDHHRGKSVRAAGTQARHAHSRLAKDRCRDRPLAGSGPARDGRAVPRRTAHPARVSTQLQRPPVPAARTCPRIWASQRPNAISHPQR